MIKKQWQMFTEWTHNICLWSINKEQRKYFYSKAVEIADFNCMRQDLK